MAIRVAMVAEQLFQPVPGGSGRYIEGLAPALPPRVHAVGITATASGALPGLPLRPALRKNGRATERRDCLR